MARLFADDTSLCFSSAYLAEIVLVLSDDLNIFNHPKTEVMAISNILSNYNMIVLLDFLLTVKAATLIFISGCGSAISTAKEGKSVLIDNLVKS